MRYQLSTFLALTFVLCALISSCSHQSARYDIDKSKSDLIDSLLTTSYERGLFNGNVVVSQDGALLFQQSFGYTKGDRLNNLTLDHIFSTGSFSKSFHVASILLLEEQGKLSFDDRLAKFMPELPSWAEEITVDHLLNYASGLPQLRFNDVQEEEDVIRHLQELDSLVALPGTTHLYNHNTPVLYKMIVERVSKSTFEDFVHDELFPLSEIKDSRFDVPVDDPMRAISYNSDGKNDDLFNPFTGWLDMTALDAHNWIRALVNGRIISESNFERFIANQFFSDIGTSLGKGVFENSILSRYELRGSFYNYRSEAQFISSSNTIITILESNGGRYVGRIAAAIDSITSYKSFEVPKRSIYWAMRDSSDLDADGIIEYYDHLMNVDPDQYNFGDPDALYYIARSLYRTDDAIGAGVILEKNVKKFPEHKESLELMCQINGL